MVNKILKTILSVLTDLGREEIGDEATSKAFQSLLLRHIELRNAAQDVCTFLDRYYLDPEDKAALAKLQAQLAVSMRSR